MCVRGEMFFVLTSYFVQVGDGTQTNRLTPVAVVGLGSGVASVAAGKVRLFVQRACWCFVFCWGGGWYVCDCEGWAVVECLVCSLGGRSGWLRVFGWCGLWCDEGCARRASCVVYRLILVLF